MIARHKGGFQDCHGFAYDRYHVDDGSDIHEVIVSVTGGMSVSSPGNCDPDTLVCIICAVLELEEKRGF